MRYFQRDVGGAIGRHAHARRGRVGVHRLNDDKQEFETQGRTRYNGPTITQIRSQMCQVALVQLCGLISNFG